MRQHASAEKAEKATAGRGDTYIHSRMLTHADAYGDTYIHDVGSEARRRHHALALTASACVSVRQHASAYVGMRQLTSAYVSIRRLEDTVLRLRFVHMCVRILPYMLLILCCICLEPAATPLSMSRSRPTLCQHTSACVSIRLLRQYTSACRLQDTPRLRLLYYYITYYITLTDHCVSVSVWFTDKLTKFSRWVTMW